MSEILVNTIKKADGTGSITVPAETGTVLTSASSIPTSQIASLTQGITQADHWRLSANNVYSGSAISTVTSNWERSDTEFQLIGSGMTESSGVFTFPATGIYLISGHADFVQTVETFYHGIRIETSTNGGSNWNSRSTSYTMCYTTSPSKYTSVDAHVIFDVASTTTHKIRVQCERNATVTMMGNTSTNLSYITFIRLGDT